MRRAVTGAGVIAVAFATMAQLPAAWQHWSHSAPIETTATDAPRLIGVKLPPHVGTQAARDWTDVRVIDGAGAEVPYVLYARFGGPTVVRREARLLEQSFRPGEYTQAVVDVGEKPLVHNSVKLHIENPDDLLSWADVAASDDGRLWRQVRDRSPVIRLREGNAGERDRTEVGYVDSVSRYIRVRILEGTRQYKVASVDVSYGVLVAPERESSGIRLLPERGDTADSVWTTTDAPRLPISAVRFETAATQFHREAVVEWSDDGRRWSVMASLSIHRMTEGGVTRANLAVEFHERSARHWRVTVRHKNDAPIADLQPTLQTTPRRVIVSQEPGRQYRLLYGNTRADRPEYALTRLIDTTAMEAATPATLGPAEANTAYADPAPWTEQNPIVLWGALGLAVLILGGLAIRTLRVR